MKLLFTSYSYSNDFNDPEKWLRRIEGYTGILDELAKSHQVTGIERIDYEGSYHRNGVDYLFKRLDKKSSWLPHSLHRSIKALNPDIVFINGLVFPFQVLQLKRVVGKHARIIIIHRSEQPLSGWRKALHRFIDPQVAAYIFSSAEFGKEWEGIIDTQKIHSILHGSSVFSVGDSLAARKALSIEGSPLFLWVGRLDENKDPITVVKAFQEYCKHKPSARLYMIFQSDELLHKVKENNTNEEAIQLVGPVEHSNLENWYRSADFIISGSHYEGGGIAVCEAMSCGCIPILTDIIAFRAATGNGACGRLYKAGDVASLLKILSETEAMDLDMEKQKVMEQYHQHLSFKAIASKINDLLETQIKHA